MGVVLEQKSKQNFKFCKIFKILKLCVVVVKYLEIKIPIELSNLKASSTSKVEIYEVIKGNEISSKFLMTYPMYY